MKHTCFTIRTVDDPLKNKLCFLICSLIRKKEKSFLPSTSFSMPVFIYSSPVVRGQSSSSSFGKIKRPASIYQRCSLISSARARPGGVTSQLPPSGLHRPSGHSGGHPSQITRPVAQARRPRRPPRQTGNPNFAFPRLFIAITLEAQVT